MCKFSLFEELNSCVAILAVHAVLLIPFALGLSLGDSGVCCWGGWTYCSSFQMLKSCMSVSLIGVHFF